MTLICAGLIGFGVWILIRWNPPSEYNFQTTIFSMLHDQLMTLICAELIGGIWTVWILIRWSPPVSA